MEGGSLSGRKRRAGVIGAKVCAATAAACFMRVERA
jgi:hypothetical protein